MSKEKRSLPRSSSTTEEENAPPNRKKAALSESPDDAVSLLLLLSRGPCNPDESVRTKTSPQQLPQLGPLGHHRRRNSSSRREALGRRVVRFAPQGRPHVVSHVSDDEDERETTTCSSTSHKTRRWGFSSQASSTRHTIDHIPVVGEMSNIPLFAMALAPPPRLPNVEFGTIVGGQSRD